MGSPAEDEIARLTAHLREAREKLRLMVGYLGEDELEATTDELVSVHAFLAKLDKEQTP